MAIKKLVSLNNLQKKLSTKKSLPTLQQFKSLSLRPVKSFKKSTSIKPNIHQEVISDMTPIEPSSRPKK